jgi:hypothetical protein
MRKKIYCAALFIMLFAFSSHSQVTITGPSCVTTGVVYMYNINGKFDTASTMKVCITGGTIDTTGKSCSSGNFQPFIKVSWNTGITSGSITLTSSAGNANFKAGITTTLNSGTIESTSKLQTTDSIKVPAMIRCAAATGGGCSPTYIYQWQQSNDNMDWQDIAGETGQNLVLKSSLRRSLYYRRKVTVKGSDSEAVTEAAAIFINPILSAN